MFDPSKPVKANNGQSAEIIHTRKEFLVALIGSEEIPLKIDHYGEVIEDGWSGLSVINIPEKRVYYLNGYDGGFSLVEYESRQQADEAAGSARTACIRIEYEEGQYDE